ncbi:MAG: hypothetical protein U0325_20810 [Polyangiales bacterium]
MRRVLWVLLFTAACAPPPARLTGRWVFLASGTPVAVGQANTPSMGGPVQLLPGSPAAGACLPPAEYDRAFGPTCPHEPEGGPPGTDEGVRWYCQGNLAVRARFERCPNPGRLRVVELAVATVDPTR